VPFNIQGMTKSKTTSTLQQITILQRLNFKEHAPQYLKHRDNGFMYFPCTEMLPFLEPKNKEVSRVQAAWTRPPRIRKAHVTYKFKKL